MGARLLLLAHHIDLDRLVLGSLLGLLAGLLHDLVGHQLLLGHLPQGGGHVVEKDGSRAGPAKPKHHDGHDGAHGDGLHALVTLHLGVHQHGDEGQHAKEQVKDDVGGSSGPAGGGKHASDGIGDGRQNTEEGGIHRHVLHDGEEGEEDGHLQEERQGNP